VRIASFALAKNVKLDDNVQIDAKICGESNVVPKFQSLELMLIDKGLTSMMEDCELGMKPNLHFQS
jgi:hypothetical protein